MHKARGTNHLFFFVTIVAVATLGVWATPETPDSSRSETILGIAQSPSIVSEHSTYVLQRGDELKIRVFNISELDETVIIRPDGRISAMLLDDIQAADLTTAQLDASLTERYADFFRDPQVTVIVRSFSNLKVYVGGEVQRPGLIRMRGDLTLTGAVLEAGGFLDSAKMRSVILLRDSGGDRPIVRRQNVKKVLMEGAPDIMLKPFDVVYVPKKAIARVDQFIKEYIRDLLPISANANFTYIVSDQRFD